MEFLVIAYDGTDPDAKERRMRARAAHLQGVEAMIENGNFINGGAIVDNNGEMIGSTLYVEFSSRAELDRWLERDPYVTGDVWRDIEVRPIKLVFRK